jgi:NADH:ubiquinone oxidoreductase subunit F (NADH-binding)
VTRLLAAPDRGRPASLGEHEELHGPLPRIAGADVVRLAADAGIRGRGGAGFPMARKLAAVAERRGRKVVVANGAEAEPMSAKDGVLMRHDPHLVLDGVALAAAATGAREAIVCVGAAATAAQAAMHAAIAERAGRDAVAIELATVPPGYLGGEETALIAHLDGRPLKPTFTPPRPYERGVRRRPTLIQNVETLAHLALAGRHGADWFRAVGSATAPGTMLVTLAGAVPGPGVAEVPAGTRIDAALARAGGPSERLGSVLLGGYFGSWLPAAEALALPLDNDVLRHHGAAVGAGVVVALPESACGPAELARVMGWLAGQSARQCGPCSNGLPAIAGAVGRIVRGVPERGEWDRLHRWAGLVRGRGACRHPDGVVRLLLSALRTLDAELRDHASNGPCDACRRQPLLATPEPRLLAA